MTTGSGLMKTTVFGAGGRRSRPNVEPGLKIRARELRADVAEALGVPTDVLLPMNPTVEYAPEMMANLARMCVARGQLIDDENTRCSLYVLALDLEQLSLEMHQDDLASSTRRLSECAEGLTRLRSLPTSYDLLDAACQEIASRCDFGRTVMSRVESGTWLPTTGFFADEDPSWFDDWVGEGIALHGSTPEARILTERMPAAVYDTGSAEVHREIIVESGQSTSYVVAPLVSAGQVVGFLHADHFPTERQVDDQDRDVLWAFAEGFTRMHERRVLMDRLEQQVTQVEKALGSALQAIGSDDHAVASGGAHTGAALASIDSLSALTAREMEVLQLIVAGASNREIAGTLVIALDTVKSHVKQILRKLGVTNRAQIIACAAGTAVA
jgi:DNA-binding CsgD family transcriptional regulator